MVLFDADYPYPKVYSDFCYQKSIRAILSGVLLEKGDWVAYEYYSIIHGYFPVKMSHPHSNLYIPPCHESDINQLTALYIVA